MLLLFTLLLTGCKGGGSAPVELRSGQYRFYTTDVEDGCLDGALEVLFMPEGPGSRHSFEYLIYVPGRDELPATYSVDFREPFVGMTVTVDVDEDGSLSMEGEAMESVAIGAQYGDCAATMIADAVLTPATETSLTGAASIDISDPRGADQLCPVFAEDPCRVYLSLEAEYASE